MKVKFAVLLSCLFLVVLVGVGCSDYTELQNRKPLDTIEIDLTTAPHTLEPRRIVLDRPGTYAFKVENITDDTAHALEIRATEGAKINYKGHGSVRTENLGPHTSNPEFLVDFEPGTYELFCPVGHHRVQGERGTLIVLEG